MRRICISLGLLFALPAFAAERVPVQGGDVTVEVVADGLTVPWAIAFLPDGGVLVTERGGRLLYLKDGRKKAISGTPAVHAERQGGLLDVVVARDFAQTREIFLSYSEAQNRRYGTALAVARLSEDYSRLTDLRVLFSQANKSKTTHHFGSRIVEGRDGTLYLTVGDRGASDLAQDPSLANGKVLRVARDGSGATVHSMGHRNPQGAALDPSGRLWTVEHGARGGDELNHPEAGKNYGWPVISYGRHYSGLKIGEGTAKPGMEQPEFYWDPSIAPSGLMIYDGDMFPDWRGDFFVGSLKFDFIARLERSGGRITQAETLFENRFERIRDVRQAPDGSIWFLAEDDGALYRISP